jgi:hypothetical protein
MTDPHDAEDGKDPGATGLPPQAPSCEETSARLRRQAEERLPTPDAPSPRGLAPEEVERLIHELRVHCTWCSTTP